MDSGNHKHGGARSGAGRPKVEPGEPTVTINIRMSQRQRAKLAALGGAAWVREKIDRARA